MIEAFRDGGYIMWPMLAVLIGVLVLSARTAGRLRSGAAPELLRHELRTILFWGLVGALLGILGTALGLMQIGQAVQLAGTVSAVLLWAGIGVVVTTTAFGIMIFLLAAFVWMILNAWSGRREEGASA